MDLPHPSRDRTNTQVLLASRPEGEPTTSNFQVVQNAIPAPGHDEVLLRNVFLSLDPYMRGRMNAAGSYAAPVQVGEVMVGGTVSEVVNGNGSEFLPGDIVLSYTGWQTYAVAAVGDLRRLDPTIAPVSTALGVLGMPGFTAYAGLSEIGRPARGETVVVAAASGPVGSVVGQLAHLAGARAVGIVGGPEKVRFIEGLGFDTALDHRSASFSEDLKAAVPEGIDVYFENVGGKIWDAVLPLLNEYARVPVCGLVATYNNTAPPAGPDRTGLMMTSILRKSLTVRGFLQSEFVPTHTERFFAEMMPLVRSGALRYREDIVEGLENAPAAFIGMLRGENFGKLLVKLT